ncbi:hypothetical protein FGB62_180g03 [Gracilaria domingensis]|nr:hypothetical protein FGB62_180g03 [Gracilaria domingensis]
MLTHPRHAAAWSITAFLPYFTKVRRQPNQARVLTLWCPSMAPNSIKQLELDFKRQPGAAALLRLAEELIDECDDPSKPQQKRGLQLLHRAAKQYNSLEALRHLAYYYEEYGGESCKMKVVSLWETVVKRETTAENFFLYGFTLYCFCGLYSEPQRVRGVQLMHRAVVMNPTHPAYVSALFEAWLSYEPVRRSRKEALALYERALELPCDSAGLMMSLADYYDRGLPFLPACEKCARKWYRRAIEAKKNNAWGTS